MQFNSVTFLKSDEFVLVALSLVKSDKLDVMLTSYDTFRTNFNDINAIDWCCMIFDEVFN